jgi:hypothetical protein
MTEEGRRKAIQEALDAFEHGRKESHALTIRGEQRVLPVIELRINIPVLNPHSHRIWAQLIEDPEYPLVRDDPYCDAAQNVLAGLVQARHRQFSELKASLRAEGQRDPGVITRSGLLVNANTRLVALRELAMPSRETVRVMVLPGDISSSYPDVLEIETSLQVQRELKDPYSLVNELLLIEELAKGDDKIGRSHEKIAMLMRYEGANSDSPRERRVAIKQVAESLQILRMMRQLADLPAPSLPLTVFDSGESPRERRQNLSEFSRQYDSYLERGGPAEAGRYAREWLIAFLSEAGAVHKARVITPGWVEEFLVDELREDDRFGDRVDAVIAAAESAQTEAAKPLPGLELLDEGEEARPVPADSATVLLNILAAAKSGAVEVAVPGGAAMSADEVRSVMTSAALGAIRAKSQTDREERLAVAPLDHISAARRSVRKASEAYRRAKHATDFPRNRLQLALRRLRKDAEAFETDVRRDGEPIVT